MSDDTMAQDGFEPRPEIETPAPEADPVAALQQENAELKRRLAAATERTNQVVAQLRFLRQQHERAGSDR